MRKHIAWGLCADGDKYASQDVIVARIRALSARDLWRIVRWYGRTLDGGVTLRAIRGDMASPSVPGDGSWAASVVFSRSIEARFQHVLRCRFQHAMGCGYTRRGPVPRGCQWLNASAHHHQQEYRQILEHQSDKARRLDDEAWASRRVS